MSARRVLITGGLGFIGSHLCERFLEKGDEVVAVDNLITGNQRNIQHLLKNSRLRLIEHDISKPLFYEGDVHMILHFASPASPLDYLNFPIQTLKVGALGTHNALGLAKAKKCPFLLASTSEVYGDPLIHPQPENYWGNVNPIGPRGVYDEAKRFAEAISMAYFRVHKVDVKIVRIFNTYGPRMRIRDGRAIPEFIASALQGKPIPVFGDGHQTRSFCYVEDLVEGIMRLAFSPLNEPVNIGNPQEMTILELAQKIVAMTGSKSKIEFKPLPQDDPKIRQPDIRKAKEKLGWQPKTPLEAGLKNTIKYFESVLSQETSAKA